MKLTEQSMQSPESPHVRATVLAFTMFMSAVHSTNALGTSTAAGAGPGASLLQGKSMNEETAQRPYVGMWMTDDGRIRHELLPGGRYDEARGSRQSAYQGRFEVEGNRIEYWDDTGFTADGEFVDDNTLHHGCMIFRRR